MRFTTGSHVFETIFSIFFGEIPAQWSPFQLYETVVTETNWTLDQKTISWGTKKIWPITNTVVYNSYFKMFNFIGLRLKSLWSLNFTFHLSSLRYVSPRSLQVILKCSIFFILVVICLSDLKFYLLVN